MSLQEVSIGGTLQPDGTLELDQKPALAPGRVTVVLRPAVASSSSETGIVKVIDDIRKRQEARGFQGRSAEEIEAGLKEGEQEYEEKMQTLRSQTASAQRSGNG